MKIQTIFKVVLLILIAVIGQNFSSIAQTKHFFGDPTANDFKAANGASPYILWQWINGCVTKEGITSDLESFKKVGIKNVQQFLIGGKVADITDPSVTVLGDKWTDLMQFSLNECERLGLDFGTHNCPGWTSSGAPNLPVELSMQKLIWAKTSVSGKTSKGTLIAKAEVDKKWNYYKDIVVIAIPKNAKVLTKENILILNDALTDSDQLKNALPEGDWDVVRFGHSTTGEMNLTAPVSGQGLEVDKMSKAALDKFWTLYPAKLIELAGKHAGKTFKRIEVDSYEAGNQDWTPQMALEFKNRRGYDLLPYLVCIAGYTLESEDITKRFRYDWQRTINELFADNYYGYLETLIHKVKGMEFLIEPYGTGKKNFDETAIRGIGDIMTCEFWTKPVKWGWETLLPVSSNAHIHGKKIVAAEAFTNQPQYAFQIDFADLKNTGDQAFCEGVNQFVLHAAAHQPWPNLKPGVVMGWFGTQFGSGQTWWEHGAKEWIDYLTRCQTLLQKGYFVADLCYLQLYRQKKTAIPDGYKADVCNEKEILTRFSVKNNTLVLPDGMTYKVLVLPNRPKVELELARKIEDLVNKGAIVVGNGLLGSAGLKDFSTANKEIRSISERLFGAFQDKDGIEKKVRIVGKGKVYCGYSDQEALELEKIQKDVEVLDNEKEIAWIHRNEGNQHYYFVSNQSATRKTCRINFRIKDMQPEFWNPITGEMIDALVWESATNQTLVSLDMDANASCFVVFRTKTKKSNGIKNLTLNGEKLAVSSYLTPQNQLVLNKKGVYTLTLQNDKTFTHKQESESEKIGLNENWDIQFQANRGAAPSAHFDKLISWHLHSDEGIKYFSGTATYSKYFQLDNQQLKSNKRISIDLGEVKNIASIRVNQKEVAVLWNPPFVADLTEYCKVGENKLEISVTNLWVNRIIGDKSQPEDCTFGAMREYTYVPSSPKVGRNMLEIPQWVKDKTERPSKKRVSFCTMEFFEKDTPLLPSGLLGGVEIRIDEVWDLKNLY